MRKALMLTLLAVTLAFAPHPALAASNSSGSASQRYLVRFKPGTPAVAIAAAHARAGAQIVKRLTLVGYDLVAVDGTVPSDYVLSSYRHDPSVAVAESDFAVKLAFPDDPCLQGTCAGETGQWATSMAVAQGAWEQTYSALQKSALPRVTVAVLDTKVDRAHPDFVNTGGSSGDAIDGGQLDIANARDWIPADQQAGYAQYHGTYVSGLVAAATNNGTGMASIGARATVLPLTVVDGNGHADAGSLADGIVYAWQHGARVINLSLGLTQDSSAVHDAIRTVTQGMNPALVVAAAGNNSGSAPFYPGSYSEVMSVAGTNRSDQAATCSNYNSNVSVSAPAEHVISLSYGGGYVAPQCGTSAAAPQVSGLAATLFAQNPARSPADVRNIIEQAADDLGPVGRDDHFGYGRINADRALHANAPQSFDVRATVTVNGASTVTATASASGIVKEARVFLDSLTSTPVSLQAADGAFDSTTESLRGTLSVSRALASGPHPIFVQSFDGSSWGPASAGVLFISGPPPVISSVSASNAVRATGQPATISFHLSDAMPYPLALGVQVFDASNKEVFRDAQTSAALGDHSYSWMPSSLMLPGSYKVKIIAADATGKSSAAMIGTIVT